MIEKLFEFRAQIICSNKYIQGDLIQTEQDGNFIRDNEDKYYLINSCTLAIKHRDKQMFAAVNDNGKGGDIINAHGIDLVCLFNPNDGLYCIDKETGERHISYTTTNIVGIQK